MNDELKNKIKDAMKSESGRFDEQKKALEEANKIQKENIKKVATFFKTKANQVEININKLIADFKGVMHPYHQIKVFTSQNPQMNQGKVVYSDNGYIEISISTKSPAASTTLAFLKFEGQPYQGLIGISKSLSPDDTRGAVIKTVAPDELSLENVEDEIGSFILEYYTKNPVK